MHWKELVRPYYLRWLYFPLFPKSKPEYFDKPWKNQTCEIGPGLAGLFPEESQPPTFVLLPMTDWHARFQRTQHLALQLAAMGHRCVILNMHLGRQFPAPWRRGKPALCTRLMEQVAEAHVQLPREPVYHDRTLTREESSLVAEALGGALRELGATTVVQIVSFPLWLDAARRLRGEFDAPVIYDCHDNLPAFDNVAREIVALESELASEADRVVFSSESLRREASARLGVSQAKCTVIRNAAESGHFSPAEPESGQPPVIGYFGALAGWFDGSWIAEAARAHPEWRFQLIGRIEDPSLERLRRYPNIELTGEVPYARLPGLARRFSAGVIPFRIDRLTSSVDPIKVYEYFACGLPVVSSRLSELARFGDLVKMADDAAAFVRLLEAALGEDSAELRARRMAAAREESWGRRAAEFKRLAEELLAQAPDSRGRREAAR
jgi:glycosyltransferase involved in cell wall biosynthesis